VTGERGDSPLEAYLDELFLALSELEPRQARHMLAEAEGHLRDAVAEAMARGASEGEAEAEAVRRFGAAPALARAEVRRTRMPLPAVVRALCASGLLLGGLGALAVGVSGAVAAMLRALGGNRFLVDSPPGQSFDLAHCATWLALSPHAHSCREAALSDWANEAVFYRLAVGVIGLMALAAFVLMRRRWRWGLMPVTVLDAVAAAAFGLASAAVLISGLNAAVGAHGHGVGQWLSAALIALPAGAVAGVRLLRDLAERRTVGLV